jgi:hypothetical protein
MFVDALHGVEGLKEEGRGEAKMSWGRWCK